MQIMIEMFFDFNLTQVNSRSFGEGIELGIDSSIAPPPHVHLSFRYME